MKKVVATGIQDFEKLRMGDGFYVDKTDFIREWWDGGDEVTLITRPRRFGKTLNMSMMNCFFSNKYAGRGELFEGLKVWEDEKYRSVQGTYPVIFLSFAGIKGKTFETTMAQMKDLIVKLFARYPELYGSDKLLQIERESLYEITEKMSDTTAALSLNSLSLLLEKHYGKKVLIFLDEYDTPLQEAWMNGYWKDMSAFIRTMFNNAFKTNPFLERAILTGITRVSKESFFSDLNNLVVVTTTSEKYSTAFGFTETEVFKVLEDQGFGEKEKREVKTWYDGFTFGKVKDIYNPWSVTNFLDKGKVGTYWVNSSSNGLAGSLIKRGDEKIKMQFEILMQGGTLRLQIDEQIVFDQLERRENAIWSLLLASGYLKVEKVEEVFDRRGRLYFYYTLKLTNLEVEIMFEDMVQGWFEEGKYFGEFVTSMLRGDVRGMNRYMNEVTTRIFSSFDVPKKTGETAQPEKFYHGFVLGLLVDQDNDYQLKSNRESGFGRYDVVMEPRDAGRPAVILEFKALDPEDDEKTLEDTAMNALKQIEEKKYDTDLLAMGIPGENILKYGIAFKGKECLIRKA